MDFSPGYDPFISLNSDTLEDVNDIIQSYIKREQLECSSYPSQSNSPSCPLGGLSPTLGIGTGDISDILNMLKDEDVGNIQPFLHEYNNVDSSTSGQSSQSLTTQNTFGSQQPQIQQSYGSNTYDSHCGYVQSGKLFNPDSPSNQLSMSPLHIHQQPSPPGYIQSNSFNYMTSNSRNHPGPFSESNITVDHIGHSSPSDDKQSLLSAISKLNTEQLQSLVGPMMSAHPNEQMPPGHQRSNVVGVATKFSQADRVNSTPPVLPPHSPMVTLPMISQQSNEPVTNVKVKASRKGVGRQVHPVANLNPVNTAFVPVSLAIPTAIASPSLSGDATSIDEMMDETNDDVDSIHSSCFSPGPNDSQTSGKRKGQRGERKTAHNLIEKRYRTSINDRIQELKVILVGQEGKMNKSGVLKRAIEHIEAITRQNQALLKENLEMKKALANKGGVREVLNSSGNNHSSAGDNINSTVKTSSSASAPKRTRLMSNLTPQAMLDRSRVSLLGFMLLVLMINPFGIVLNANNANASQTSIPLNVGSHGPSRTLLNAYEFTDESEPKWLDGNFRLLCIWILNLIVIGCVLARLLIYGEPITEQNTQSWTSFWRIKAQAEADLERNDIAAAVFSYSECLKVLGRPLPVTAVDQWSALLWQLLRQFLNRVVIGRWLSKQRRGGIKPFSVMQSHGHAAMIYHRLQQLHLMGFVSNSTVSGLTLSLSAVNLAEAAGKALCPARLVEIYVTAAMQMRIAAPKWTLPARYFLTRSRHACKRGDVLLPQNLFWIFHPAGHQFFVTASIGSSRDSSIFVGTQKSAFSNPLDCLTADFKVFLLKQLAECLIFGAKISKAHMGRFIKTINGHLYADILECSQLLLECGKGAKSTSDGCTENTDKCLEIDLGDEVCQWWASLISCSINWAAGDLSQAKLKYAVVRNIPKALLTHPLALAVGHAFCARKVSLENFESKNCDRVVWFHCCKASETLATIAESNSLENEQEIQIYMRIVAHQWVLISLLGIWERHVKVPDVYWKYPGNIELSAIYYENLKRLRHFSKSFQSFRNKALLFDIAGRMINGANPVSTGEMVNRCHSIYTDIGYASTDFELKELRHLRSFHVGLQTWAKTIQ